MLFQPRRPRMNQGVPPSIGPPPPGPPPTILPRLNSSVSSSLISLYPTSTKNSQPSFTSPSKKHQVPPKLTTKILSPEVKTFILLYKLYILYNTILDIIEKLKVGFFCLT